jgi:hypothetical protein
MSSPSSSASYSNRPVVLHPYQHQRPHIEAAAPSPAEPEPTPTQSTSAGGHQNNNSGSAKVHLGSPSKILASPVAVKQRDWIRGFILGSIGILVIILTAVLPVAFNVKSSASTTSVTTSSASSSSTAPVCAFYFGVAVVTNVPEGFSCASRVDGKESTEVTSARAAIFQSVVNASDTEITFYRNYLADSRSCSGEAYTQTVIC